jgi:hypothetical protein
LVAMEVGCYGSWLLWKLAAMEVDCYGSWLLKESGQESTAHSSPPIKTLLSGNSAARSSHRLCTNWPVSASVVIDEGREI